MENKKSGLTLLAGTYSYTLPTNVTSIQSEILRNGPVETAFVVYSDFVYYSGGVYIRTTDEMRGVHAVRIIGWGVENEKAYWLVANSWGRNWGENGTFKIIRGTNECEFESYVIAGHVARPSSATKISLCLNYFIYGLLFNYVITQTSSEYFTF